MVFEKNRQLKKYTYQQVLDVKTTPHLHVQKQLNTIGGGNALCLLTSEASWRHLVCYCSKQKSQMDLLVWTRNALGCLDKLHRDTGGGTIYINPHINIQETEYGYSKDNKFVGYEQFRSIILNG